MNYTVNITPQAEADLRDIFEYIAFELLETTNAVHQIQRLEESILSLDQMPSRYRAYAKEPWHSRGLRVMPVDNYLVFYIPDGAAQVVTVIRVMYGGRDMDAQLNQFTEA